MKYIYLIVVLFVCGIISPAFAEEVVPALSASAATKKSVSSSAEKSEVAQLKKEVDTLRKKMDRTITVYNKNFDVQKQRITEAQSAASTAATQAAEAKDDSGKALVAAQTSNENAKRAIGAANGSVEVANSANIKATRAVAAASSARSTAIAALATVVGGLCLFVIFIALICRWNNLHMKKP